MIVIKNLSKVYKINGADKKTGILTQSSFFKALDDINLEIRKGELFCLLGPNGAGKTTLMKILTGLLQATSGEIMIDGLPVEKVKARIGLMLGYSMIYYLISGYENLEYFAKLYNVDDYKNRIMELAEFLGLEDVLNERVEYYSTGMKSKLALARALIHNPDILLLDEPTLGLDPYISLEVRKKIKDMGKTIILTTHYMEEAEQLSDRIGFLSKGKLVKLDTADNLKQLFKTGRDVSLEEVFIKLAQGL